MYIKDLFEKYAEWKILKYFLDNPEKEIHVKALSRKLEVSPGTVSVALNKAFKDKILEKEIIGNIHLYSLNKQNQQVKALKSMVGKI